MLHLILLQIGEPESNPVSQMATQFGVDGPKLLTQVVLFAVIIFCLKKFAYGPLLQVLEERRNRIAESLANADKIKQELAQAEASRRDILHKAGEQANALIAEAQKAASIQGEKRLQEATAQAEAILRKAQDALALDREKMLADLRREVAALVLATTAKVTGKVLTADDQQRIANETVVELQS